MVTNPLVPLLHYGIQPHSTKNAQWQRSPLYQNCLMVLQGLTLNVTVPAVNIFEFGIFAQVELSHVKPMGEKI